MNLKERIEESLKANPGNVALIGSIEIYTNQDEGHFLSAVYKQIPLEVYYFVAPKQGLYEVEELQEFMQQLIPLDYDRKMSNFLIRGKQMRFGALHFKEEVAREYTQKKTTFTVTDRSLSESFEPIVKEEADEREIRRDIEVYVFPNEEIAKKFYEDTKPVCFLRLGESRSMHLRKIKKSRKKHKLGMTLPVNRLS